MSNFIRKFHPRINAIRLNLTVAFVAMFEERNIEKEYTEELSVRASEESFYKLLSTSEGQSAAEAVVDFVNNDNEIVGDFLVIAPRQNETNECKVSSLTMMLITQTKINLLIVKR